MEMLATKEVCIDEYDVEAIGNVFASLDLKTKLKIDLMKIANVLRRKRLITDSFCDILKANVKKAKTPGMRLLLLNKFIWESVSCLSFGDFVSTILDSGYSDLYEMLILQRQKYTNELLRNEMKQVDDRITVYSNTDTHLPLYQVRSPHAGYVMMCEMPKRHLPYAESLIKYYTKFKMLVDNNAFERGNREELNCRIKAMDELIKRCSNESRKQLLVDERLELYFLLTQQYADFRQRNAVLLRLRDSMPHRNGTDRTAFDIIFHSYMSINCAFRRDPETASAHMYQAMAACETCQPCLPTIVLVLSLQIMKSESGTHLGTAEYLHNIEHVCENAFRVIGEFTSTEEEETFWKRTVLIQKACSLLGINNYCKIRHDFTITDREVMNKVRDSLSKARNIRGPIQYRRKMFLYYCIGRFHDVIGDRVNALKYVRKARALEDKGCFDDQEKINMREYEAFLNSKITVLQVYS